MPNSNRNSGSISRLKARALPRVGGLNLLEHWYHGPPVDVSRRVFLILFVTMLVPNFFVNIGQHGLQATESGVVNLGSVVFVSALIVGIANAVAQSAIIEIFLKAMISASRNIYFSLFAAVLGIELFSSIYSTSPIGAIYQSAPAILTVLSIAIVYYLQRRSAVTVTRDISIIWNFIMIFQSWALLLLILSGFTGRNGFVKEAGLLSLRLQGSWFAIHPDLSGVMAEVGFVHFMFGRPRKSIFDYVFTITNLVVLIFAQSRTSYSLLILSFGVWYIAIGRKTLKVNLGILATLPVIGVIFTYTSLIFQRGQTSEDLQGLTGRTKLWEAAINFGSERPIFGYGAFSGIRIDFAKKYYSMFPYLEIRVLDNQFINTFVETGIIGLSCFIALLFSLFIGAIRRYMKYPSPFAFEMLALAMGFPLRSWLGQLLVLYDATQFYVAFLVLWLILPVATQAKSFLHSPVVPTLPSLDNPTSFRPYAGPSY